jgi:hypothetical protein
MSEQNLNTQICSYRFPSWGLISLFLSIGGNALAGAMLNSSNGPSNLAGGMIALLICLSLIFIIPVTTLVSLARNERPAYFAISSFIIEATLVIWYFKFHYVA